MGFKETQEEIRRRKTHEKANKVADEMLPEVAQMMVQMLQVFEPIVEGVAGYKAKMIAAGFAEPVAEQLAITFHQAMITIFIKSSGFA